MSGPYAHLEKEITRLLEEVLLISARRCKCWSSRFFSPSSVVSKSIGEYNKLSYDSSYIHFSLFITFYHLIVFQLAVQVVMNDAKYRYIHCARKDPLNLEYVFCLATCLIGEKLV